MRDYPVQMWAHRLLTSATHYKDGLEGGGRVGGTGPDYQQDENPAL